MILAKRGILHVTTCTRARRRGESTHLRSPVRAYQSQQLTRERVQELFPGAIKCTIAHGSMGRAVTEPGAAGQWALQTCAAHTIQGATSHK